LLASAAFFILGGIPVRLSHLELFKVLFTCRLLSHHTVLLLRVSEKAMGLAVGWLHLWSQARVIVLALITFGAGKHWSTQH
jgi:hypothetical protein